MLPEKKVENEIKKYLDHIGAYHIKIHGSAFMPAGTPDILACVKGVFVGIEVKKPKGGRVSDLQKLKIKQIEQAGGIGIVANDVLVVQERFEREHLV
ncbi:VRR-NUC domain-containing protein [Abiotrophia defectiva]|uniref:VRR-NUC domain protein n=1 Tax=Abiotrophia defectiva ATCC 49176 TaxID=592010 RepID=W1Q2K8_ABIDE|nr:VRR-NUC domain-containing protein [Abiotrophia defectiva]ESK65296.1 VRR-NUC domain protein [Abiotrophia defectiva ATCC 49176]